MVSLEDPFAKTIREAVVQMADWVREVNHPGDLSGLVAHYFLDSKRGQLAIDWCVDIALMDWLDAHETDFHDAPQLATLGLLLFNLTKKRISPLTGAAVALKKGLELLSERKDIFTMPNSWAIQPNIVIGITLGICALKDGHWMAWARGEMEEGIRHSEFPLFLRLCYLFSLHMLNSGVSSDEGSHLPAINSSECTLPELALSIWLVTHGVAASIAGDPSDWLTKIQADLLRRCLVEDLCPVRDEKAAIVLEVLLSYIDARSHYPRLDLVVSLLGNFEPAMERWIALWPIHDEYAVQTLLWLILRSSFDDLRYEEYLPKLGRRGQRYDIGIPQLGLVVEAKYARKKTDFQRFVDEIGTDSAQLGTQTDFKRILVFIYDQSCSVEQYSWAKETIRKINLVSDCIIVSAPSMCRTKTPRPSKPKTKSPAMATKRGKRLQ